MSLIADLLSKIKPSEPVRDVPPLLKDTIQRSSTDRQNKKRLFILLTVAAAASIGIAAMYLISDYDRPDQLVRHAPVAVKPAPPIPESKMNPPPAPMPVEKERTPTAPGRKSEKKAETAGVSARKAPAKLPAPEIKPVRMEAASGEKTAPPAGVERKEDTGSFQKPDKQGQEAYLYAARSYENRKDYRSALDNYGKALSQDPHNYRVMNNMASALIRLGAFQEAADYAARALVLRKDYVPSLVNSGIACGQLGKFAEAEAYLERAYRLEPANRTVLLNLGLLEEGHQSDEKAAETYARLSALGDAQGCLGLARISERQGKTAAAIDHYRAAMARERRDSQIWNFANDRIAQLTR